MSRGHYVWEHISDDFKHIVDTLSIGTMLATVFQMLPGIAAIFTIVWTAIRIYESATVQKLLGRSNADSENDRGRTPRSD